MAADDRASQALDKLNREQLEIYAKELREHVRAERHLRQELEGRNRQLEQRVREITALNQLFQRHLEERQTVVETYRKVLQGLQEMVSGVTALEEWARSQPLPDHQDLPALGPDDAPSE